MVPLLSSLTPVVDTVLLLLWCCCCLKYLSLLQQLVIRGMLVMQGFTIVAIIQEHTTRKLLLGLDQDVAALLSSGSIQDGLNTLHDLPAKDDRKVHVSL